MNLLKNLLELGDQLQGQNNHIDISVLIVEDDYAVGILWQNLLRDKCHSVDVEMTSSAARRHITNQKPDILILDWRLPNGDGKNVFDAWIETIRGPLVVVSGYLDVKEQVELMQYGAWNVLTKPEAGDMILPVILRYIDIVEQKKQYQQDRQRIKMLHKINVLTLFLVVAVGIGPEIYGLLT